MTPEGRWRVLVVDDDEVDREGVRRALVASASVVVEADSCAEARERILDGAFDAVFLDYRLPDGDGLALLREIRASGNLVPVVILTGQGDEAVAVELMKAGADDYLVKGRADADRVVHSLHTAVRLRKAEEAAAEAERERGRLLAFMAAITDSLAEGVVAADVHGRVTFANRTAQRLLGWDTPELVGRDVRAVLLGDPAGAEWSGDLRRLAPGRIHRDEDATFLRRDGSAVPVSYALSPILAGGRVAGCVLAFHDVTDRKTAEAELEASRRQIAISEKMAALGTLVSGVAHEVRTPLTYVANNLFLIRHRVEVAAAAQPSLAPVAKDVTAFAAAAMEGVDRVNLLVKDLRRFADNDVGRREYAGLHEIVAGALGLFRATQRGRIELVEDLAPTPLVEADAQQIQRVVLNLLINAAEAMPNGGRVHVGSRARNAEAEIYVRDEGPGLPDGVEDRIYDPFFTTKPSGLGLGLSICRRIVEAHGGRLRHENRAGEGVTFVISLPTVLGEVPVPRTSMETSREAARYSGA